MSLPTLTPAQWARVKDVFNAALELEPGARPAFVADASAGDDAVRSEVQRLLDAQRESGDFIERPPSCALLSGRVISHYEIGRLIGSGGMGHVYAARDTELGRDVALKVASFDGEDAQARLRREAQHASRLSHPHICHIYDVGRADGQIFVVMELVLGRPLSDVVREGPLPTAMVRRYGMEIADALSHAHEHRVTHRDLKSTNVMITPKRGAKVLDFGLARMLDTHQIDALSHSQRSLTGEGVIAGTLPYMAPELLRGERGDQRSDIWALGVLLYEMAAGHRPFSGATGFEVSAAILHQEPPTLRSDVPPPMRTIIQRCLEKHPDKRYQDAADVHLALEELKGMPSLPQFRIPHVPKRLLSNSVLFALGLLAAALVWYVIRSPRVVTLVSNVQGYSLLEEGRFEEAIRQFEGVTKESPHEANAWDSLGEGYLANGMPERALESYARALAIDATFESSIGGRALALAALGRYEEALQKTLPDIRVQAFLLSRVGRYREAHALLEKARQNEDAEIRANTAVTSAWLLIEEKNYARAVDEVAVAHKALADRSNHSLLVLADLMGGVADIRSGNAKNASVRLEVQRARHDSDYAVEARWVAALEGEIALAQGRHDDALSRFEVAQQSSWLTLNRDASTVLATNLPSRDGAARVALARGNRAGAIEVYRRLTDAGPARRTPAVLEPRDVLELARLLHVQQDRAAARVEYERFVKLWANADADLPELHEVKAALARLR